jgi:hypothetical protein
MILYVYYLYMCPYKCKGESPQIGHPPDPDELLALSGYSVSGKEFVCMTASVAAKTPHLEDLSDL